MDRFKSSLQMCVDDPSSYLLSSCNLERAWRCFYCRFKQKPTIEGVTNGVDATTNLVYSYDVLYSRFFHNAFADYAYFSFCIGFGPEPRREAGICTILCILILHGLEDQIMHFQVADFGHNGCSDDEIFLI
jgi:hypothetical protein